MTWNGGGDCFGVGGHFVLEGAEAARLLEELPPVVHVREERDRAEMRWLLETMSRELREERPGASVMVEQLATMILVQALRQHLAEARKSRTGWLFALGDAQIKAAIAAMHGEPAERWTLERLGARCGMSRTVFAARFKERVGISAMEYLARWRMLLARDRLTSGDEPVAAIAGSLGYESESAFSKAFRRVIGCSPRQARRSVRTAG